MQVRRSLIRAVALGTVLLASASCTEMTGPFSPRTERLRLEEARDKWVSRGPMDYSFTVRRICECMGPGPLRVTVANGQVVSVRPVGGGDEVAGAGQGILVPILDLFELALAKLESPVDGFRADYHPSLGYPTWLYFDEYLQYADDEWGIVVSDLSFPID